MRNHANLIESLPISVANRVIARANYEAAEASIARIARVLDWLRECGWVAIYTAASVVTVVGAAMALSLFVPT